MTKSPPPNERWAAIINLKFRIMKYKVSVTEKLERIVVVSAKSPEDAISKVEDMYYGQEIILDAEDMHEDAEFKVLN